MPKGGKRKGAGRKPRQDNRAGRLVRIPLTIEEHLAVLRIPPDKRREILLSFKEAK
jgi:hypothetical protein